MTLHENMRPTFLFLRIALLHDDKQVCGEIKENSYILNEKTTYQFYTKKSLKITFLTKMHHVLIPQSAAFLYRNALSISGCYAIKQLGSHLVDEYLNLLYCRRCLLIILLFMLWHIYHSPF